MTHRYGVLFPMLLGCALAAAASAQTQKHAKFPAATCGAKCGEERWIVKALADEEAGSVNFTPKDSTVTEMRKLQAPRPLPVDGRVEPVELTTYRIKALLTGYVKETDHDFHLVITEPNNKRITMIAEITDPGCRRVCQSKKLKEIQTVRESFVKEFGEPPSSFKTLDTPVPVTITGVGFFDFRHGQHGVAPNAIELHPVLSIERGN